VSGHFLIVDGFVCCFAVMSSGGMLDHDAFHIIPPSHVVCILYPFDTLLVFVSALAIGKKLLNW